MDFFTNLFQRSTVTQLEPDEVTGVNFPAPAPHSARRAYPAGIQRISHQRRAVDPAERTADKLKRIPRDRSVVCVCASGNRSSTAARRLEKEGYKVSNMKGGMTRWMRSGLPVKKGMAK